MSTTARVLAEIAAVKNFFSSRHDGLDSTSLQKTFADSLLLFLTQIKEFGPNEAGQVVAALNDNPIWRSPHSPDF